MLFFVSRLLGVVYAAGSKKNKGKKETQESGGKLVSSAKQSVGVVVGRFIFNMVFVKSTY